MNRNIRVEGLSTRERDDGTTGAVLTAPAGDGCISADMTMGAGTIFVSRGQTIVRIRYGQDGGISEVAVDDDCVWEPD